MNKIKNIIAIIVCAVLFEACQKKTDEIFDQSVDQRLSESLSSYQTVLTTAPGWKFFVYPQGLKSSGITVGGFTYYIKFSNTNRATMVSDFATDIAAIPGESGWRLKALQRPSLIFDTYGYMQIAADPDEDISSSPTGTGGYGWGTDFNFSFTKAKPTSDTMYLEGNFNNSSAVLMKATSAEMDSAFNKGRLARMINNIFTYTGKYPNIALGNTGLSFDLNVQLLTLSTLQSSVIVRNTLGYSYTTYGLHLEKPVTIDAYTFQDIYWDDATGKYYILSGTNKVFLSTPANSIFPAYALIGFGNSYANNALNLSAYNAQPSTAFATAYTTARANMTAAGFSTTSASLAFRSATELVLRYNLRIGTTNYVASYYYPYTRTGNQITLGNVVISTATTTGGNGDFLKTQLAPLYNFFSGKTFTIDYNTDSRVGFYDKGTPANYSLGVLGVITQAALDQ